MTKIVPYQLIHQHIGEPLEPGDWFLIDQSRINLFAEATEDFQFIHVDEEKARQTELGGTIAHGFLTLSVLPKLVEHSMLVPEGVLMGINYGFDKVRFLNPVRPGDEVRLQAQVADVQIKSPGRVLIKLAVTIQIKGQTKPALVCEWLNLFVCQVDADG